MFEYNSQSVSRSKNVSICFQIFRTLSQYGPLRTVGCQHAPVVHLFKTAEAHDDNYCKAPSYNFNLENHQF